ncbi:hypothetical protein OXX69_004266 [Metschnikowia pulcherrima]
MFRKSHKQAERQILDVVNSRVNGNRCGECGADYPTWASVNLGILLCGRCASSHRKVLAITGPNGDQISRVKSLTLENWSPDEIEALRRVGNKRASNRWNPKQVPFPHDDDDDGPIQEWLREKYVFGRFRDDRISSDDYGSKLSKYTGESGYNTPDNRSRSSSTINKSKAGPVPRLSHRKPTSYEQSQYRAQAHKIAAYGYNNKDAIFESLVLSQGDVEYALDILDLDAKVNPSSSELPPELPKRPASQRQTTPQTTSQRAETPATSAGSDWWTGQIQPGVAQALFSAQPTAASAQPQIYQYTDPLTGQVSYVDANGQQYLDPNNPQHQQMLAQQTNPQFLTQQATKQNIMSLYSQPEQYATNVAAPMQPGQAQAQVQPQMSAQTQAQPQLQQQFTQQFAQPQFTGAGYGGGQFYGQVPQQPTQTGQQFGQQQYWR